MTVGKRRTPRRTGPDETTTQALYTRAQGRCEVCNVDLTTGREYSKHHRIPRGRGGNNDLANLLLLCGTGTTGCHGMIESHRTIAYEHGWLVRSGYSPGEIPVRIHGVLDTRVVYLTSDGQYADGAP